MTLSLIYSESMKQTKPLYNPKVRSLFTQLICETESLYEKVLAKTYSMTAKDIPDGERELVITDYQNMTATS